MHEEIINDPHYLRGMGWLETRFHSPMDLLEFWSVFGPWRAEPRMRVRS